MKRTIVHIDEEKCNGCGACARACHEGAIAMIDGKARLIRDDYCDGLGDCLPACPTGAISFVVREARPYSEEAVQALKSLKASMGLQPKLGSCPGLASQTIARKEDPTPAGDVQELPSRLAQWPCQIKLAPVNAPYFQDCDLLVAADCTAYAYASFHERFMKGRVTLMGCPKLDAVDYADKLTAILSENSIRRVTLVRMQVPCCGGMENALRRAVALCGRPLPLDVVTLTIDGRILP